MGKKKWLILILLLAAALRFYKLPDYLQFLGDQGRDVLVVKRMIVDHQWTLLGPTASVGGFYTGPIYYYFMLPFLWLWQLDPVGPAVMASLFGLGTIILLYYLTKLFVNEKVALIAAFLAAISPKLIETSRFSWNPNPMPFFALLTVLLIYYAQERGKKVFSFLAGVSVGVMVQLHYIDLVFVPILGICLILAIRNRQIFLHLLFAGLGILFGNSLFLIFEIRHGFPNLRTVWEFVNRGSHTVGPRSFNPIALYDDTTRRLFEAVLGFRGPELLFFYYSSVVGFFIWALRNPKAKFLLVWFFVGILGIGSYRGQLLDHYFGYLFPLPIIFLAITSEYLLRKKILLPIFVIYLLALSIFQVKQMYFWYPPNNLVMQTQTVDKLVLNLAENKPYNFALLTFGNSDQAYRYFLEIWGQSPLTILNPDLDPKRLTVAGQLIVVCEDANCKPLGNPLWEVAGFGRAEIVAQQDGPVGIKIFKLVHYKGK